MRSRSEGRAADETFLHSAGRTLNGTAEDRSGQHSYKDASGGVLLGPSPLNSPL